MPAGVRLRELGPPRTDDSSGWERVLKAGGANLPQKFSVFLSIHGTAGPGVTQGGVTRRGVVLTYRLSLVIGSQ